MENYGAVGLAGASTVMLYASSYENLGGPAHLGILLFTILHHHHMTTQSNKTTCPGLPQFQQDPTQMSSNYS